MALYFMHWLWQALLIQTERAGLFFKRLLDCLRQTAVAQFAPRPHTCPTTIRYHRRPGPWRRNLSPTLPDHAFAIPSTVPYGEVYFLSKGHYVSSGATAFVDRLESGDIIKYPKPNPYCPEKEKLCRQQMEIEAEAYKRIGDNHQFLTNGDLQSYIERYSQTIPTELKHAWTRHAVEAVAVVHSASIIHCDVTPRNFLLNEALELHLSDFAGSSVSGSPPSITTSPRFQRPGWTLESPPIYADDLFALGSVLYYIQTGHEPYYDLTEDEVQDRFNAMAFPDVSTLNYGGIIHKCWTGDWSNAQKIIDALAKD
ncbi:hypothetical protein MY11210_005580 [Beauveria gryllotalpidicola]